MLLNHVSVSQLERLVQDIGFSTIEENIIKLRYGKEKLSIEDLCDKLHISKTTYKKHRLNILYKFIIYFDSNN
jgi:hypothetical protein